MNGTSLRRLGRRASTVVATAWLLVLVLSPGAEAHNGVGAAFKGAAGSYTVYAYDGYINPHGQLEYRLVLLDRSSGEPVSDVQVGVTARALRQPGTSTALVRASGVQVLANVVFYDLPNPYPGDWEVRVEITGAAGRSGQVSFPMHGAAPLDPRAAATPLYTVVSGSTNVGLIAAGAGAIAALAALGGLSIWVRRHRRKT